MENVKITGSLIAENQKIPSEIIPTRLAVATNILFFVKDSGGEYSMLLFNYDPINWKQLYPYFFSHSAVWEFKSTHYADIVNELNDALIANNYSKNNRIENTKHDFCKSLNIPDVEFYDEKPIPDEYWIKYSKSQNSWTIYLMEFYQVRINEKEQLKMEYLNNSGKTLIKLDKANIDTIITTGKIDGLPVIDNTIEIIKDKDLLNRLFRNAVEL